MMLQLLELISQYLTGLRIQDSENKWLTTILAVTAAVTVSWIIYKILNRYVGRIVLRFVEFTSVKWDDIVFNPKVLRSIWRFVLSLMLAQTLPDALSLYPSLVSPMRSFCQILMVAAMTMIMVRLISAVYELTLENDKFKTHSLMGVFQMIQLVFIIIGTIVAISILIDRDPIYILSGLGAAAAVILLVFQDTILGLVAGIQLSANNMLRPGDWISAPKSNANGVVLEVTLTTVKVQNFDMTIITIPPYTLVKDSFQNWRGMQDSKGRRIMRSLNIDMTTVRRLSADEMQRYQSEPWFNDKLRTSVGDTPVNLSLLRHYLQWRILQVPTCRTDMTAMVRELQPTPEGLPVEIYFFTSNTEWVAYEHVQADLIDDILAAVSSFDLKIFQLPAGNDIRHLTEKDS